MLFTMFVGLFTSRVVLQTLGVEDYGIYNVVGGVVVLFTFINSAMSTGTQRHLSYELGKTDGNVSVIYSACLNIHVFLAAIIILLSETIGLWFLNYKLNIPIDKMTAANWVYQISIINCAANIIRVPHNALIISHERMNFYAYTGIVEAILKLLVCYLLFLGDYDKLCLYAILQCFVTLLVNAMYVGYCRREISSVNYIKVKEKSKYKELISFSGWTLFGSIANMGLQQGLNILVNLFFGVALNAAVGIANQVNSNIASFVNGFQQALNPQLTKSEAAKDRDRQFDLICKSSKFSFLILLVLAFPIITNIEYVLTIWLGEYPMHTVALCKIIIIGALIDTLSNPLWVSIFATGHIKHYQIAISSILLLNIPIAYVCGFCGLNAELMYASRNAIYLIALFTRLLYLRKLTSFNVLAYLKRVLLPLSIISISSIIGYIILNEITQSSFIIFATKISTSMFIVCTLAWFVGLDTIERKQLGDLITKKIRKQK